MTDIPSLILLSYLYFHVDTNANPPRHVCVTSGLYKFFSSLVLLLLCICLLYHDARLWLTSVLYSKEPEHTDWIIAVGTMFIHFSSAKDAIATNLTALESHNLFNGMTFPCVYINGVNIN